MEPTGSSPGEGRLCACGAPARPRKGSAGPIPKRCDACQRTYQAEATAASRTKLTPEERSRRNIASKSSPQGLNSRLKYRYGITLEDYDNLLEQQNNGCAICARTPEENGRRLSVDHNHETGEVRGLLCQPCNQGLGLLQDSPLVLSSAVHYLIERGSYGSSK